MKCVEGQHAEPLEPTLNDEVDRLRCCPLYECPGFHFYIGAMRRRAAILLSLAAEAQLVAQDALWSFYALAPSRHAPSSQNTAAERERERERERARARGSLTHARRGHGGDLCPAASRAARQPHRAFTARRPRPRARAAPRPRATTRDAVLVEDGLQLLPVSQR